MTASAAIELLIQLINAGARLSALIKQAQTEGRDTISAEELASIVAEDDTANALLAAAIAKAQAEGR